MALSIKHESGKVEDWQTPQRVSFMRVDRFDCARTAVNEEGPSQTLIGSQLIVDANLAAAGRELLLDAGHSQDDPATAAVLVWMAVNEFDLSSIRNDYRTFVRATPSFIHCAGIELLAARSLVLELDLDAPPDDALIARCRALRDHGFSFALGNYRGIDDISRPLLSMIDVVAINIADCDESTCSELAGSLSSLPIELLAQGVETAGQLAFCQRNGFTLFQGNHIAPSAAKGKRWLPVSRCRLVRLLTLVDNDADLDAIEDAFKKEVSLVYNLLCLHQVAFSTQTPGARHSGSLKEILAWFDRRALKRWLQLQLTALDSGLVDHSRSHLLMQIAALRGRMLERLIGSLGSPAQPLREAAYLTGCLSMMPVVLKNSMRDMLQSIAIGPEIQQALLSHEGLLGQLLDVLESFDRRDTQYCDLQLQAISGGKLKFAVLNDCFSDALTWLTETDD